MHKSVLLSLATLALAAAPAAASDSLTLNDPCGDNRPYVEANDFHQDLPTTSRTARFDVNQVAVASVTDGVAVSFANCDAPDATGDGFDGIRAYYTSLSDGCQLAITVEEGAAPGQPRKPSITKTCTTQINPDDPTSVLDDLAQKRFQIELPASAISVAGNTLTLTVSRMGLTGEAADAFAPGAVWSTSSVLSEESPTFHATGSDTDGNHDASYLPTGEDTIDDSSSSFTVS